MNAKRNMRGVLAIFLLTLSGYVNAGIPVIDGSNLTQNIVAAFENTSQTLKQIEQYRTQLQQYDNMLRNSAAPAVRVWAQATRTMNDLRAALDTLDYYKNQLGSLERYFDKFRDLDYYMNSPCFDGSDGCSQAEKDKIEETQRLASESERRAVQALLKSLDEQQEAMERDAQQLERLQNAPDGGDGRMKALGYANQLAAGQYNQLLAIRSQLAAQQAVLAAFAQKQMDREAREEAAKKHLRQNNMVSSPEVGWGPRDLYPQRP
jgi:P-type conjugative transfer protein TrbJ